MRLKLPKTLHCSFCGKSQHQVEKLIAGPSVFVCNECVALCSDIIAGKPLPEASRGLHQAPGAPDRGAALAGRSSVNLNAADAGRDFLQSIVDTLRSREVSWADIAEPLGVSRQSAWERFS